MRINFKAVALVLIGIGLVLVGRYGGIDFGSVAYTVAIFRCIAFWAGGRGLELEGATAIGFVTGIVLSLLR